MKITGPVRFVINPVSGIGEKKILEKYIPEIMDPTGMEYDVVYTEYAGHAIELARKSAEEKTGVFVIAGGDGSVHEAALSLAGTQTILAIIPSGSGNGIARHFGIELDPLKCIREFLKYEIFHADTWNINGDFFLGFAGCGFDAVIANAFKDSPRRGFRGYARLVRKEMKKYTPHSLEINEGKNIFREEVFIASFCNVSQFGNNIFIDAEANATDGEISFILLKPFSFIHFPSLLYKSYRGKLHDSKYYKKICGKEIRIRTEKPILYHLDGEPAGYIEGEIVVSKNEKKILLLGRRDGPLANSADSYLSDGSGLPPTVV